MRRTVRGLAGLLLGTLALAATIGAAGDPAVHVPGATSPAVLEQIESFEGLTALAVSPDLERVVVARLVGPEATRSSLELLSASGSAPLTMETIGLFRDLLFDPGGAPRVYGVLHRSAKKREGDTYLVVWELDRGKLRRATRLPASSRSLDHWTVRNALLVAARDELRTLLLPDLRSGPLFRVSGENLAVSTIAGSNQVLVGQRDGLVLVNLNDPPGQFEMPIRGSVPSPAPVVSVASSPDGGEALARLEDGRLFAVGLDPLTLSERGTSRALTSLEGRDEIPVEAPPYPAELPPREQVVEPEPALASSAPAATAETEAVADTAPEAPLPAAEEPAGEEPTVPPSAAETAPEPVPEVSPAIPESSRGPRPQIRGRVDGPARAAVREVVILGPDSIMREAGRVTPAPDGSWEIHGLAPGRYRIQLDGGGGRVLVSDPPFQLVDVTEGDSETLPTVRVIRSL